MPLRPSPHYFSMYVNLPLSGRFYNSYVDVKIIVIMDYNCISSLETLSMIVYVLLVCILTNMATQLLSNCVPPLLGPVVTHTCPEANSPIRSDTSLFKLLSINESILQFTNSHLKGFPFCYTDLFKYTVIGMPNSAPLFNSISKFLHIVAVHILLGATFLSTSVTSLSTLTPINEFPLKLTIPPLRATLVTSLSLAKLLPLTCRTPNSCSTTVK